MDLNKVPKEVFEFCGLSKESILKSHKMRKSGSEIDEHIKNITYIWNRLLTDVKYINKISLEQEDVLNLCLHLVKHAYQIVLSRGYKPWIIGYISDTDNMYGGNHLSIGTDIVISSTHTKAIRLFKKRYAQHAIYTGAIEAVDREIVSVTFIEDSFDFKFYDNIIGDDSNLLLDTFVPPPKLLNEYKYLQNTDSLYRFRYLIPYKHLLGRVYD